MLVFMTTCMSILINVMICIPWDYFILAIEGGVRVCVGGGREAPNQNFIWLKIPYPNLKLARIRNLYIRKSNPKLFVESQNLSKIS